MRSDYKGVRTALSESLASAKMHVSGTEDEAAFEANGVGTTAFLLNHVGTRIAHAASERTLAEYSFARRTDQLEKLLEGHAPSCPSRKSGTRQRTSLQPA